MAVFPRLVRRVADEAERHLRGGLGRLALMLADPNRSAEFDRLLALVDAQGERVHRLEETLRTQDAGLRALRGELDSLIAQLNDRLLPRIDERMDDLERDLTAFATGLVRTGRETAAGRAQLETVERRLADLRERQARTEERAGLWRDLQASMARLGDDIDALRARVDGRPAETAEEPVPGEALA
ncbi:hypothetical protein [Actinomadura hibisca]|uniref:hypothetical protein n=1 Tax=Actinomadura hibisca TaxID=68565 RepID=UPI000834D019|nr:hypothetical protein [Actinomadura hibisca]